MPSTHTQSPHLGVNVSPHALLHSQAVSRWSEILTSCRSLCTTPIDSIASARSLLTRLLDKIIYLLSKSLEEDDWM